MEKETGVNEIYNILEYNLEVRQKPEYSKLVNFSENFDKPRHRWFDIKEGFSAKIIKDLIKRFDGKKNDLIFDPFSGSGTTLLVAKELGIPSLGFEINPFLAFICKNKLFEGKIELEDHINKLKMLNIKKKLSPPKLSISQKLFDKEFDSVLTIKDYIASVRNEKEKNLLNLAFLCSLEKASKSKKDGNGLKYPKNKKQESILETIIEKIKEIQEDINNFPLKRINSELINSDVRELEFRLERDLGKYREKVSLCLFSPPYMNCFDYTEIYKVELWFGDFIKDYSDLKELRNKSLDSHLNKVLKEGNELDNSFVNSFVEELRKKNLWSKKIPIMVAGYFEDMWKTLKGIYKILRKDGICVIVVGNSAYGNIVIPTDLILGKIGLGIGFKKCEIEVARKLGTSPQQYKEINKPLLLRESLVILRK